MRFSMRERVAVGGQCVSFWLLGIVGAIALLQGSVTIEGHFELLQGGRRPAPQTFHWMLPAQYTGVEVTELHSGDCYVIQQVEGLVYFAEPEPEVLELQERLGGPLAHLVESPKGHPECVLAKCVEVSNVTRELITRLLETGNSRAQRLARHRPSPLDNMRGGVYSDVGSADRSRYRQTPEQRMAYLHLQTAARDNCYEAQAPRTLTIHIRDHQLRPDRTGVYSGYLYLEHHHDPLPGRVVVNAPRRFLQERSRNLMTHSWPKRLSPDSGRAPSWVLTFPELTRDV